MLVALPSAIAFGVTIYATIGGHYGAYGAIAGILGVAAIGIVASIFSGSKRLISAPSAPAAAVLSAFALTYISQGIHPDTLFVMLMIVALFAGIFQILFGLIGLGKLIKYMPFPVVSGYLSGVGFYIIISQMPKFLGLQPDIALLDALQSPALWQWPSILTGIVTIFVMFYADKVFHSIPSVIIALVAGMGTYALIGLIQPSLFIENNPLVIGHLGGIGGIDFLQVFMSRFTTFSHFSVEEVSLLLFPALTLAVLLSIDTLKTCVIVDSMTHSFHDSNKELIAQGSGNITSSLIGGMPGSGMMGATMVNISGGATSPLSGFIEGVMAILAFAILGSFIAWIPVAALSGILIVIALRMIDRHSFKLLSTPKTALDFFIILAVALTAITISLISAAGVGLLLAILLYLMRQIEVSVIYRQFDGSNIKSKIIRSKSEQSYLKERENEYSLYELHGSLFFGTANQLYTMLQDDLQHKKYIILDMKRVQTVDLTAAHILLQIKDILHEKGGYLILSRLPHKLPSGDDMESYFNHIGLLKHLSPITIFEDMDDAIEWIEEKLLEENPLESIHDKLFDLSDFDLFKGRKADTLAEIETLLVTLSFKKGEIIYRAGDSTGQIFLIRRGSVRIVLSSNEQKNLHLNTLRQGSFFGEFSFLEGESHYTDSIAVSDTEVYMISRDTFDLFYEHHKKTAFHFMESLAMVLAQRLKVTRTELAVENDV